MANLYVSAFKSVVFASFLAFMFQIIFFSPIDSPQLLEFPPKASSLPRNNDFQGVIKLGEGLVNGPESVSVDKDNGILYTATRDGWIKRYFHENGSLENWKFVGGDALLGLTTSSINPGDILVCDVNQGLIKVNEDGVTVLASETNGTKIRFADDVIEASDGMVYFSDCSLKFGLHNWYLDLLEGKPQGRILKYDPFTRQTSILIDGLYFPNGVTLSKDHDFLVFCETWKFRCMKYWLKGEKLGKTETLVDNLPGAPDNINVAPDGSFWIAQLQLTRNGFEFVHTSKAAKYIIAPFGKLLRVVNGAYKSGMVVKVTGDGKIINKFEDRNGEVMSFVTSATEFDGHLYLGSLNANFIGKLKLNNSSSSY